MILKYINLSRLIHCSPYAGANLCHRVKHGTLIAVIVPCVAVFSTLPAQRAIAPGAEHFCYPVRMMFALHLYSFSARWVSLIRLSQIPLKSKSIVDPVFDAW
jgi:hypothetical protein